VFISFEGIGGAGKTTQTALLVEWLTQAGSEVVATREPGGTPLGEVLRELLLSGATQIDPRAEAALFAAARAQDVDEVIRPAIDRGAIVVADRFVDSSIVYQGLLRGVGAEAVLELNRIATDGVLPNLTFVLTIDEEVALKRRGKTDRIEPRDHDSRLRLVQAYRNLSAMFPERVVDLDAAMPKDEVFDRVRAVVSKRIDRGLADP
jgi:dTMP kinase